MMCLFSVIYRELLLVSSLMFRLMLSLYSDMELREESIHS